MSTSQQIDQYYETYWSYGHDTYSGDMQGYASNFRRWMQSELRGGQPARKILEVGCGDAAFTRHLAEHSTSITALDISANQIARNAARFPSIQFLRHDVSEPLPFPGGEFDVVWCSEVLEHLFDPAFALKEMYRVLVPGGRLLVTVPYHGPIKNILIALFKWEEHFAPTGPHIRFFTKKSLGTIARAAGFTDIKIRTCGIGRPLRDRLVATNILLSARKAGGG